MITAERMVSADFPGELVSEYPVTWHAFYDKQGVDPDELGLLSVPGSTVSVRRQARRSVYNKPRSFSGPVHSEAATSVLTSISSILCFKNPQVAVALCIQGEDPKIKASVVAFLGPEKYAQIRQSLTPKK